MFRFSDWVTGLRPDFWKVFYEHPDLLNLFSYVNSVQAAKSGGYDMLSMYDILDIGEHNPGHTLAWEPIDLGNHTYVQGSDYPFQFPIDENWIYIDCLHDKRVDPEVTLQNIVDFRLIKHKLCFIKYPYLERMLVSKGLYAGTRLADDFGKAFGFERKDSFDYRDKMVPMMELFYRGPTLHNIKAAANVMINNPVAKYGNEKIINTSGGDVITDIYRYNLAGAHLAYNVGDTIGKHFPFADAIELATEKTNPSWWLDRLPKLFSKYKVDGPIDKFQRDLMMEKFLKYFVAHIRINLNKIDWREYVFYKDLWELLLDGSPTRTDYILSMYYQVVDLDMPIPNFDVEKVKLTAHSIWGRRNIPSEMWLHAPTIVKPTIYIDGTTNGDWYVGSLRYHILDADKKTQEFWSSEPKQWSYVEPHISHWYGRFTLDPKIPMVSRKVLSEDIPDVQDLHIKVDLKRPAATEIISVIPVDTNVSTFRTISIYGDQNIAHEDLDEWEHFDTCHLGVEGLVVALGKTGYGVSPAMNVGGIPKNIIVRVVTGLASNTNIDVFYSYDKSVWEPLPIDNVIRGARNDVYYKAVITASSITSPVFKGLDISIRV